MSPTNWHLPRAFATTKQGHLPSTSVETEPYAAAVADLQHSLRGIRVKSKATGEKGFQIARYFQALIS